MPSKLTGRCRAALRLAGGILVLALLACNARPAEKGVDVPGDAPAPETPTSHTIPAASPTDDLEDQGTAEGTAVPTGVAEDQDPLAILDTYPSLTTIRRRLDDMVVTHKIEGTTLTGRELLEWILLEQQYDPAEDNSVKERLFAGLDAYNLPHRGARIFLVNVATGLFAEAHRMVPWSLRAYSVQAVNNLFIEDDTLHVTDPALHRGDLPPDMPNVRAHQYPMDDRVVEDAHYKQFNLARSLTQGAATQEEAAELMVVWLQQNFFHAVEGYGWEVYLDGRPPRPSGPVAYPLSIERIYEERVIGCHEPTILLEGMLHALNIPAVRLQVQGHGVLYLPTLGRYVHGDHVAAYTDAPPGVLLLTPEELRPFAEDESWIYDIVYQNKYRTPFGSMPLWRDGDFLYIHVRNARNFPDTTCIQVSDEDWARISRQLTAYNLRYDAEECELSSDRVPILSLDQLNDLDSP